MNEWNTSDSATAVDARVKALVGRIRLRQPDPTVSAALRNLFAPRSVTAVDRLTHRIAAVLRSDAGSGALAGARGTATVRQCLFASELADISVQIRPANDGTCSLDGIVLPHDDIDEPFAVELRSDDAVIAFVVTDLVGSFRLHDIPEGVYQLAIQIRETEIIAGPLAVDHS
jgi:hypothetical protein